MIPDFPQEKEKLMRFWIKYLSAKNREFMGFFGTLPFHMNHEGRQWALNRADGSTDNQPYNEIQSLLSVEIGEVPTLTPDKIRQKLDKIAKDMAHQMSRNMFKEISRVTREVGNEVNAQGQPLTQELVLQILNKDEINSWETDETFLLAKQKEIIAKKKEAWHDRENHRELVD